jgi:competence protein ComEC
MVVLLLPLVVAILLIVDRPPKYPAKKAPNRLQERLYGRLESAGLTGDELATTGALTLGYKEDLDKDLKHHFQASGAAHVLAVSGLHTGIIYGLVLWLLTLGGRYRPMHENRAGRRTLSLVIICAMWGYAWLTGMTPSVVRAVLMVTLVEVGRMAYRNSFSINTIASAAVLILIVRPTDLWSVSFQLSFAATAAIVLFLNLSIYRYADMPKYRNTLWGKILSFFGGIIIVSIAAQLGTLPITMFYFHQVSTYFLLANLMVLPIATLLVPFGLASIALGGCTIGNYVGKITEWLAWSMNHSVGWIESLPGSTIPVHISGAMVGIYYVLFILLLFFIPKKQ